MDWGLNAVATATAVLIVMAAARWGGPRVGGLAAALPTFTAPSLAWIAHDGGIDFAVDAAIGSVAACAMLAAFAVCYARAARFGGAVSALLCGLLGAIALAIPAQLASARMADALLLSLSCCVLAFAAMPDAPANGAARRGSSPPFFLVAAAAAGISALAANVGPSIGGFATGLMASLPLITGAVAMAEHAACGHVAATRFLKGYVGGLFGKAAFGVAFAVLAPRYGAVAALSLGCACAGLVSTLQLRSANPQPAG